MPNSIKKGGGNLAIESVAEIDSDIIFPLNELKTAACTSPFLMWYKTDTHATLDGTFIAYQSLMKKIQKDFPYVKILSLTDFDYSYSEWVKAEAHRNFSIGNNCDLAGLPRRVCETFLDKKYRYYRHKDRQHLSIKNLSNNIKSKGTLFYPKGVDLKVMIFGDSYMENLMDVFPYSFKNTYAIRLNDGRKLPRKEEFKILKYYREEIEDFKPDIVVLYMWYGAIDRLKEAANKN